MTGPTIPGDELSDAGRLLVEAATAEARGLSHRFVGLEHVLLALLSDPDLAARAAATRQIPPRDDLRTRFAGLSVPRGMRGGEETEFGLSPQARRLLKTLDQEARAAGRLGLDRWAVLERIITSPRGPIADAISPGGKRERSGERERGRGRREAEGSDTPRPGGASQVGSPALTEDSKSAREREGGGRGQRRGGEKDLGSKGDRQASRRQGPAHETRPAPPRRDRPVPPPKPPKKGKFRFSWRSVLLLMVPLSWVLAYLGVHPGVVFAGACLGVVPLAGYMGEATEHLAARTGPAIGGLLNATFGNAAELIIAIVALRAGLVDLVKASITGSILGNLLFITGLAFIAGSKGKSVVTFNRTTTGASAGMLALAVVGLVFPALFHTLHPGAALGLELGLSEAVAIVLAVTYGFSLLFSLRTHRSLFSGEPHPTTGEVWRPWFAMVVLAAATLGVVVQSEILVGATESVVANMNVSQTFLGLILIPIIGNAAEHAAAVVVARKGKMDLALHIALGSSTQVALLIAPALVLAGVLLGQPMNLVFTPFEVAAVGLATIITAIITLDGEAHWFEGVQLLATYSLFAITAFVM